MKEQTLEDNFRSREIFKKLQNLRIPHIVKKNADYTINCKIVK